MEFSVIIPTRNRPDLLKIAIKSVMEQTFDDFEIIVVNDGSNAEYDKDYQALKTEFGAKVVVLNLERSWHGHGPNYTRNMGMSIAKGNYLCFLDDDDEWIDPDHLRLANSILKQSGADVYFTNQKVYLDNRPTHQKIWLSTLGEKIDKTTKTMIDDAYPVSVTELLKVDGFCHLNTTIVTKELFQQINGFDEHIPYEGDRAFYYRVIDNAKLIIYNPKETSRHNMPDIKQASSVSTKVSELEKMLSRLTLLNKGIIARKNTGIQKLFKQQKVYNLKLISDALYRRGSHDLAYYYAREALLIGFTFKWLAFTGLLFFKATFLNSKK